MQMCLASDISWNRIDHKLQSQIFVGRDPSLAALLRFQVITVVGGVVKKFFGLDWWAFWTDQTAICQFAFCIQIIVKFTTSILRADNR